MIVGVRESTGGAMRSRHRQFRINGCLQFREGHRVLLRVDVEDWNFFTQKSLFAGKTNATARRFSGEKLVWRECMGIEPTSHPCGRRNGFEDRGDHQVSSTPKSARSSGSLFPHYSPAVLNFNAEARESWRFLGWLYVHDFQYRLLKLFDFKRLLQEIHHPVVQHRLHFVV